jgi:hypothetical protein
LNNRHRVTLVLNVSDPQEVGDGVFETVLTHPRLQGELRFVHSATGGREELLKSLDENIVAGFLDIATLLGGLLSARHKNPQKTTSGSNLLPAQPPVSDSIRGDSGVRALRGPKGEDG